MGQALFRDKGLRTNKRWKRNKIIAANILSYQKCWQKVFRFRFSGFRVFGQIRGRQGIQQKVVLYAYYSFAAPLSGAPLRQMACKVAQTTERKGILRIAENRVRLVVYIKIMFDRQIDHRERFKLNAVRHEAGTSTFFSSYRLYNSVV